MKPQDRTELEAKPRTLTTMVPAPIIVVVDRGTMKAYEMEQVPIHGWVPRLLEEITFSETHGRYRDRYTDQAGAFPATGTLGYAIGRWLVQWRLSIEGAKTEVCATQTFG